MIYRIVFTALILALVGIGIELAYNAPTKIDVQQTPVAPTKPGDNGEELKGFKIP